MHEATGGLNMSEVKTSGSKNEIDLLLADREFNSEQHREVSRSLGWTFVVAITGVLAALFLGYLCPDARGPVNTFLPCALVALYVLVEFQGLELMSRERYLALIEWRIRSVTGGEFPYWESGFRRIIYHTWRHEWLMLIVASPLLLLYVICIWKAVPYLAIWHYPLSILALAGYILLPAFAVFLVTASRRELKRGLAGLEKACGFQRSGT